MSQITVADLQGIPYAGYTEQTTAKGSLFDVLVLNLFNVLASARFPDAPLKAYLKADANPDIANECKAKLVSFAKSGSSTKEDLGKLFADIKDLLDRTVAGGIFYIRALDKAISEFQLPAPNRAAKK